MGVQFEELYVPKDGKENLGPQVIDIDDVLESESAMIRFMGGEKVDPATMEWVRRSLAVIRNEIKRRRDY
jgi:hypothetical protein